MVLSTLLPYTNIVTLLLHTFFGILYIYIQTRTSDVYYVIIIFIIHYTWSKFQ